MTTTTTATASPSPEELSDAVWTLRYYATESTHRVRKQRSRPPLGLGRALEIVGAAAPDQLPHHLKARLLAELAHPTGTLPDFQTHATHYLASHAALTGTMPAAGTVGHDEALQTFQAYDIPDLCSIEEVLVDGRPAVWIYSEAEVVASLGGLTNWVAPATWPEWGPSMFLSMVPTKKTRRSNPDLWREEYTETTRVLGKSFVTKLMCSYQRTQQWVGMTYDLPAGGSQGDEITVDRGFLLATPLDDVPDANTEVRFVVRALKIVAFTDPTRNVESLLACPMWTAGVRESVKAAGDLAKAVSTPGNRHHGLTGSPTLAGEFAPGGLAAALGDQWVQRLTECASTYNTESQQAAAKVAAGTYGLADYTKDTNRLFQRLAQDWAQVYKLSTDGSAALAELNVDPDASAEYSEVLALLGPGESFGRLSDLKPVAFEGNAIRSAEIRLFPLDPVGEIAVARMRVNRTGRLPGLYAGTLSVVGPRPRTVAALMFVSQARPAG